MAYSEDHIALAAEYALGTLDADERAQAETMMAVDAEFAAVVHAWEYRLGALNQMVGAIEPRPTVWENIKAEIARSAGPNLQSLLLGRPRSPWARAIIPTSFS
jgi:anti-sigma-K factor RskA